MATRMQQRRGTASQWTSSNDGDGPILNAGEIGWESDTNKFKIGDGVSYWADLTYFVDATDVIASSLGSYLQDSDVGAVSGIAGLDASKNLIVPGASIIVEGTTDNGSETTLTVTDPTADRTITFPDATGTVVLRDSTDTLTNKTLTTPVISSITNGAATLTLPTSTGTIALTSDIAAGIVTETGTQTLTNKTLTSPVVSGLTLSDSGIVIEGSSADAFETTLTVTNPTADRTITFPDSTGTVALTTDITASNLANDSITAVKLAGDSVTTSKIQNLAVETGKINDLAVTTGKIAEGAVTSGKIADGTIVDGDINAAAAIAQSKISGLTTDLGLKAPLADPTFTGTISAASLTLSGNLTVNGTTTNINSTNLVVEDKNIVLADVESPTDTTADGGGITLKGATDKTFNWVDSTDAWTSSEHINLASGKTLKYNGTDLVASQSGNSGKYLTTDGTTTSWGTVTGYSAPTLGSTSIASGATVTTIVGLTKVRSDVFTTLDIDGYEVDIETMTIMGAF
jgi:hypothetical protein